MAGLPKVMYFRVEFGSRASDFGRRTSDFGLRTSDVNRGKQTLLTSDAPREVDMFARHVAVKLRPGALAEFIRVMDDEVLPWLRKQKGFLDTITLAVPGGKEIVSISFWDQEKNAEVYNSTSYPQALEILKKILAGTPQVRTFDVVSSTLQKIDFQNASLSTARPRRHQGDTTTAAGRAHRV